ncbi:BlaI/MecI/CopY family transcriptional regulator [Daejeonella sp.]|uniref:BlaI/MecI/CopY family transcriptional regulator n=1 Tax=Daejeonella sp. TaxID=2805397 RepID=UPI0030C3CC1D
MEKLTPNEEEAMQAVWNSQNGTIKKFLEIIPEPKPPYTTLASTVKNLERKKFILGEKTGNTFSYTPLIKEEEYKKTFMGEFVNDYFSNSYKELVTFFANQEKISADDLKEIIKMIEKGNSHDA